MLGGTKALGEAYAEATKARADLDSDTTRLDRLPERCACIAMDAET